MVICIAAADDPCIVKDSSSSQLKPKSEYGIEEEVDQIIWNLDSSGKYTAYNIQLSGSIVSNFPRLIWKVWAPSKCKIFLLLLLQDRLWTAARLQVRDWENNYFCGLCFRNLETVMHLFLSVLFPAAYGNK